MATKQNLVKRKFPYIDTFDHTGPAVVRTMCDLTSGLFGRLYITTFLDVDKRVNDMQHHLRRMAHKKYKTVLVKCKESVKGISGYQWTLIPTKDVIME